MSLYINPNAEIREAVDFGIGVPPQQFNQNDAYQSDWIAIKDVHRVVGVGQVQNLANSQKAYAYFRQAKTATGGSEKDVSGSEVSITADGEQDVMVTAEVQDVDLDNEFDYVAFHVYHDDGANPNGSAIVGRELKKRDGSYTTSESTSYAETTESEA